MSKETEPSPAEVSSEGNSVRKQVGSIITALAEIVRLGDQSKRESDPEVILREPVMRQVGRIRDTVYAIERALNQRLAVTEGDWPLKHNGPCACRFIREQEFGDAKQVEWCGLHATQRDLMASLRAQIAAHPVSDDQQAKDAALEERLRGFRLTAIGPCDYLTDEANSERRWMLERVEPPFEINGNRFWIGATIDAALSTTKQEEV